MKWAIPTPQKGREEQIMNKIVNVLAGAMTGLLLTGTAGNATAERSKGDLSNNSNCIAQASTTSSDAQNGEIVIISHVDVVPQFTQAGVELLKKYRKQSLNQPGAKRIAVLQQIGRPNHFTVVEEWSDERALDEHVSAAPTKEFRAELQPLLGAPYDERPHASLE
jgi:quinol monooxygenase YgiN